MATTADTLGTFVQESVWEALPSSLVHEAKRSLLNFFAGALGVARTAPIDMVMRVLLPFSGAQHVTVIGRRERLDPLSACFVNAVSANLLDYDDTHLRTVIHPTAPVAPAVLALAESRGLSGTQVLHAFILGAEIECRLGNSVSPEHYARGWHITATCGVFGAAAAAAHLLGLSATQTAHALGIAASQSAGLVENLPSAAKNVGVGNAARAGLFAALMAEQGCEAAPAAIEGRLGWAAATSGSFRASEVTDGLGEHWEFAKNTYKPYPCGIVLHAVIDACLALRAKHKLAADEIARVTVRGDALLLARGDRAVGNERDARVSIHHSAAVVFLLGAAGLREFSDSVVMRPDLVAWRERVVVALDPALPLGAATVEVEMRNGRTFAETVMAARGSEAAPLSDSDLEAKAHELAAYSGWPGDVDGLIAAAWSLDEALRVDALMHLLAP